MTEKYICEYCGDEIESGQEVYSDTGEIFCSDSCLTDYKDDNSEEELDHGD